MKISALLREAPGTPTLSLDQDLMQRAKLKFPGYDSQQALSLYMADKLQQQQKIDASQNNLINAQRNAIQTLQGELDANDDEIERIKQLTAKVTAGGADTRARAKVSGDELEKLQKQLEELKSKPGMDSAKYKEIEQQIISLANNAGTENSDVRELQKLIDTIQKDAKVDYDEVLKKLALKEKEVQDKEDELDSTEDHFKNYKERVDIYKNQAGEDVKRYADIVKGYEDKINDFGNKINNVEKAVQQEKDITLNLRAGAQEDAQKVANMKDQIEKQLNLINKMTGINSQAQNDPTMQEPSGTGPALDNLNSLYKGKEVERNITKGAEQMVGRKLAEEAPQNKFKPLQTYKNPNYNKWITENLSKLINLFKNTYWRELEQPKTTYTDRQIHYIIEKYTPLLYNLGDEHTPLTKEQIENWLEVVKDLLWDQPVEKQLELFSESLNRILQLSSIKKG